MHSRKLVQLRLSVRPSFRSLGQQKGNQTDVILFDAELYALSNPLNRVLIFLLLEICPRKQDLARITNILQKKCEIIRQPKAEFGLDKLNIEYRKTSLAIDDRLLISNPL